MAGGAAALDCLDFSSATPPRMVNGDTLVSPNGIYSMVLKEIPYNAQTKSGPSVHISLVNALGQTYNRIEGTPAVTGPGALLGSYLTIITPSNSSIAGPNGLIRLVDPSGNIIYQESFPFDPAKAKAGAQMRMQNDGSLVVNLGSSATGITTVWSSNTPQVITRNILTAGTSMGPGDLLLSANKMFSMQMDKNGILTLKDSGGNLLWQSYNSPVSGAIAMMNTNGTFTIAAGSAAPVFFIEPQPNGAIAGSYLQLQDDGSLTIEFNGVAWADGTTSYPIFRYFGNQPPNAVPIAVTTEESCGSVADFNAGIVAHSQCGTVSAVTSGCGAVTSGLGMCAAVMSGVSFCGTVYNGASLCGVDTAAIGLCGAVAAAVSATLVGLSAVGVCGAVASVVSACGAAAAGAAACAAAVCGAAACGADVNVASGCVEAEGAGTCAANANLVQAAGVCAAQVGFCGAVLCIALPIGGNW